MKLILLFGPQAVGKMSIGEKLSETSDLPLFHNHITLDVIWPYIGWNEITFELSKQLRMSIFQHIANDLNHHGLIFIFVWVFNLDED